MAQPPSLTIPGPVVLDTNLASAIASKRAIVVDQYREHLTGRPLALAFVTVAELRYGALRAGWQQRRLDDLESFIRGTSVVMPDNDLVTTCARLRVECRAAGHPLHEKVHEADRWIAATALRHGLPVVTNDGAFLGTPGLVVIQEPQSSHGHHASQSRPS